MGDTQRNLEIEVTDFGPIVEAKIDLRPLTVFIGPSNSGKSYLAMLIYALHRYFSNRASIDKRVFEDNGLFHPLLQQVMEIVDDLVSKKSNMELDGEEITLPKQIRDIASSVIDGRDFANEIERCFGLNDVSTLIRKEKKGQAFIGWKCSTSFFEDEPKMLESQLRIGPSRTKFSTNGHRIISTPIKSKKIKSSVKEIREFFNLISPNFSNRIDEKDLHTLMICLLSGFSAPYVSYALNSPAYYLPADRTGILHALDAIFRSLIASASRTGSANGATPRLSGVSADFLEQLIRLDPQHASAKDFGRQIEKSVLQGIINIEQSKIIKHPRFTFQPQGWRESLSLMNTSSMISELIPIILYLRYIINPNDVLIIEEPEAHLHPAMQIEFIRQLVPVVRAGIKVVVITHSEWLLEELANIVQRSKIPTSESDENERSFSLDSRDVGVWLFKPRKRPAGSVVMEIELDQSGLYPTRFDDVAVSPHNDWARIRNKIGMENDD